jgi:hypothetical protein
MHEPDPLPEGGPTPLPRLLLYMRPGCHLCEDARDALDAILAARSAANLPVAQIEERDIETNEAWHARYLATIPVVELGDRRMELAVSPAALRRFLADALGGAAAPAGT